MASGGVLRRRSVPGRLATAALALTLLGVVSRLIGMAAGSAFPEEPVVDLGHAGPWVASYARAAAAGSWGAALVCLSLVGVCVAHGFAAQALGALRRFVRRSGGPSS